MSQSTYIVFGTIFFDTFSTLFSAYQVFLRISIYHPTSEGLNFWTKQLLVLAIEMAVLSISNCIVPWYEAQQERWRMSTDPLADKEFQIQANASEFVKRACQNGDLNHQLSHISEPLELQLEDNQGVQGKDDEYQALCSDISDAVEDLENIISQTGDSGVSNAHDLDTLWGLIERSKWAVESEDGVKEIHGDEIDEEEWSILGESVVLVHRNEGNMSS
ncbi:uncharacterized protein EAE98_011576 [Botrytis deweyae]|uniref:Uncharacterized protein n=1 Tax=Botrytis deweyae TaxID=2478750 RepID=A0ABQ7I5F3_9HELO|nr:uncharacterized protein EAE98_011576 [Botrytis deweyae]KAF7913351.1 hypothetical protein EAE98_011576 [Botrytis deweyae]